LTHERDFKSFTSRHIRKEIEKDRFKRFKKYRLAILATT